MYSRHRQGVKNLLTSEESKKSLELAMNSWKARSELWHKIGKGKYILAEYEKIKRITMPFGDSLLLYVTAEVEARSFKDTRQNPKVRVRSKVSGLDCAS